MSSCIAHSTVSCARVAEPRCRYNNSALHASNRCQKRARFRQTLAIVTRLGCLSWHRRHLNVSFGLPHVMPTWRSGKHPDLLSGGWAPSVEESLDLVPTTACAMCQTMTMELGRKREVCHVPFCTRLRVSTTHVHSVIRARDARGRALVLCMHFRSDRDAFSTVRKRSCLTGALRERLCCTRDSVNPRALPVHSVSGRG